MCFVGRACACWEQSPGRGDSTGTRAPPRHCVVMASRPGFQYDMSAFGRCSTSLQEKGALRLGATALGKWGMGGLCSSIVTARAHQRIRKI